MSSMARDLRSGKRPNVVLILSDQHQAAAMGNAGHRIVATPHLDSLAANGVSFTNAYCNNPLCVPSRSILLTGRHSRSLGIYDNKHILEGDSATLPSSLRSVGYRTCLIGKMHFNGEQFHGFDERPYGDLLGQGHQPDPRRTEAKGVSGLGDNLLEHAGPSGLPLPLTNTEVCLSEAAKWLNIYTSRGIENPFFLCVSFDKPHFPLAPPRSYFHKYEPMVEGLTVTDQAMKEPVPFIREHLRVNDSGKYYGRAPEVHRRALASYYGCVEWVDNAVGRLMDVLEYLGLRDRTVVIYSSDHGEMATSHGLWQKTVFFEDSVRVPLIVSWPGEWAGGIRCGGLVGLVDILPTVCDLCGAEVPDDAEGVSIVPLLEGGGEPLRDDLFAESVVLGSPEHAGCMMRVGRWKYCYYLDGSEELYDLEADPNEFDNLALGGTDRGDGCGAPRSAMRERVRRWWEPERQVERYWRTSMMRREKHYYPVSNQFVLGSGAIVDSGS